MVCYGCFAFFLLLGGLLVTLVGYYPLDMDHNLPHRWLGSWRTKPVRKTRHHTQGRDFASEGESSLCVYTKSQTNTASTTCRKHTSRVLRRTRGSRSRVRAQRRSIYGVRVLLGGSRSRWP